MTIFSVLQNIASFIFVDKTPDFKITRTTVFLIVLAIVGPLVYMYKPKKS